MTKVYYRLTFGLELVSALSMLVALFLPWHSIAGTAFDIFQRPMKDFYFPYGFFNVWWLMWGVLPIIGLTIIRGANGLFMQHREGERWAWGFCLLAAVAMGWLYGVGDQAHLWAEANPHLQQGFWLTISSLALLGVLIWSEGFLPVKEGRGYEVEFEDEDAKMRVCGYCGSPNDWNARRCGFCGIMLETSGQLAPPKKDK